MNSIRLVVLSMVVGIAIGAGLMAWRQQGTYPASMAGFPTRDRAVDSQTTGSGSQKKTKGAPEDGYTRVANALVSIDERISLMEARAESSLEKQNRLVDQVRELAITLEVKSGDLKPLREDRTARLEPMRGRTTSETLAGERAVPLARPDEPRVPLGGEEMPEW